MSTNGETLNDLQAPAVYRRRVGDAVITALSDGYFDMPFDFFPTLSAEDGERLLVQARRPSPPRIQVNAFLIEASGRTILVDTGCGGHLGPTVNKLRGNLAAAGVAEAAIDTVLCTHIHPDHTNGLVDGDGGAVFANAEVVVHEAEAAFWLSEEQMGRAPDALKPQFQWAMSAFAPYKGRVRQFRQGEVLPGVEAVPLYGHTPGHSGYVVHSGGHSLLIWGDAVHSIGIQSVRPEISFAADVDQAAARETRLRLFDQVAADKLMVTGMHLEFPGFGYLTRSGESFRYDAEPWSPTA